MKKGWVGMYNGSLYIAIQGRGGGERMGGRSSEALPHVDVKSTVFSDAETSRPVTLLNVLFPEVEKHDTIYMYITV